jgi:hypothetical protein
MVLNPFDDIENYESEEDLWYEYHDVDELFDCD